MSIANSERSTASRRRDTGFPEPFCGNRNTTLPHPDADTSPNACISQEDISVSRVASRQRRSFLAKHSNKRTISHGYLTPEMHQMYNDTAAVTSDSEGSPTISESARLPAIPGTPSPSHATGRPTSGGGHSFASASTGDHDDAAPRSPAGRHMRHSRLRLSTDSGTSSKTGRRRSFMEKFGLHRHRD